MTYAVKTLPDGDLSVTSVPADHQIGAGETLLDELPDVESLDGWVLDNGVLREKNEQEVLEVVRSARVTQMAALAHSILLGGFNYDGRWYSSSESSRASIKARALSIISSRYRVSRRKPMYWRDIDGTRVRFRSRGEFDDLVLSLDTHQEAVCDAEQTWKTRIESSADPGSLDLSEGWPPTRVPLK